MYYFRSTFTFKNCPICICTMTKIHWLTKDEYNSLIEELHSITLKVYSIEPHFKSPGLFSEKDSVRIAEISEILKNCKVKGGNN